MGIKLKVVAVIVAQQKNFVNSKIERSIIMKNQDIRNEVKAAGLKLWQIAEELGIYDWALSRLFRHELSDEKKAEIRSIIEKLKKESV